MAVKLRLKRMGRTNGPFFRLNAIESRSPRDGRVIEELGYYDPRNKDQAKQFVAKLDRCRHWLEQQSTYVPLHFIASDSSEAIERYGEHLPWLGYELVVVSERGEAWIGPAAFLVCLWATREYREWSYRLAGPAFAPLAKRFFKFLSSHRRGIARLFEHECTDGSCRI